MPDHPPARFLTLDQIAEELATSVAQIRALVRRGDLRAIQIGGRRQWRAERSMLEAYIEHAYAETAQANPSSVTDSQPARRTMGRRRRPTISRDRATRPDRVQKRAPSQVRIHILKQALARLSNE